MPYAFTDVNDEREIHNGDEVSFYMAKNKRSGALRARMVRLVQSAKVETIQVSTNASWPCWPHPGKVLMGFAVCNQELR